MYKQNVPSQQHILWGWECFLNINKYKIQQNVLIYVTFVI